MNKMKSSYSIMTFNIHNFMNYEMKDNLSDIQSLIRSYDIIALQEVYDTKKLHIITQGYNYSYNKGLLLMTKYPIQLISNKLNKESFTSLIIHLPLHKPIFVTNVHLNYKDENIRNQEIDEILDKINTYSDEYQSILLGDFNALTKADYSPKEWADIYKIRKYGQWELPVHELSDKLNIEWYDCGKNDKHITCRYNTRIDYIYTKNMNIISYNVLDTIPSISDHNLVNIKFQ